MIAPGIKRLVIGPDGKLRMLWRAVIFFALAYWVLPVALDPAFDLVAQRLHLAAGLTAANVAINEFENFIVALICTAIFARHERRRVDSYGLPVASFLMYPMIALVWLYIWWRFRANPPARPANRR
jgi:hypothetical protein